MTEQALGLLRRALALAAREQTEAQAAEAQRAREGQARAIPSGRQRARPSQKAIHTVIRKVAALPKVWNRSFKTYRAPFMATKICCISRRRPFGHWPQAKRMRRSLTILGCIPGVCMFRASNRYLLLTIRLPESAHLSFPKALRQSKR